MSRHSSIGHGGDGLLLKRLRFLGASYRNILILVFLLLIRLLHLIISFELELLDERLLYLGQVLRYLLWIPDREEFRGSVYLQLLLELSVVKLYLPLEFQLTPSHVLCIGPDVPEPLHIGIQLVLLLHQLYRRVNVLCRELVVQRILIILTYQSLHYFFGIILILESEVVFAHFLQRKHELLFELVLCS